MGNNESRTSFPFTNQNYAHVFPLSLSMSYSVERLQQILIITTILLRISVLASQVRLRKKLVNYQMGFIHKDKHV